MMGSQGSSSRRVAATLRAAGAFLLDRWNPTWRHDRWQAKWSRDDFRPQWADRGYTSVGVDIAEAAFERAHRMFQHLAKPPEFHALDLCASRPATSTVIMANRLTRRCRVWFFG
jgi:hypothetical protein